MVRRTEVAAVVLALGGVLFTIGTSSAGFQVGRRDPTGLRIEMVGLFILSIVGELGFRFWLRRALALGRRSSGAFQYLNAFFEVAMISSMILVFAKEERELALFLPNTFAYFVIIAVTTLSLSFKVTMVTGAFAALNYVAIALALLRGHTSALPFALVDVGHHVAKGALILLTGVAAGLVAAEIRKRAVRTATSALAHERILGVFGRHVSPEVAEKLVKDGTRATSEAREVCVMFLDIRDFTAFSSGQPPERVVAYLNQLFPFMVDVVNQHHGIINKFLGDGFMAVFGAPVSTGNDADNAVRAARALVAEVLRRSNEGTIPETRIGIGLHFGKVVTGTIGSDARGEYTIIGEVVNLASRIEGLNKSLQTTALASDAVRSKVSDASAFVPRGEVPVKGVPEPVAVYAIA